MLFGRKKMSAIDRRIDELRREMAKVGTEIKSAARCAKEGGELSAGAGLALRTPPAPAAVREPPGGGAAPERQVSALSAAEAGEAAPGPGLNQTGSAGALPAGESAGDLPLFEQRSPLSMSGREKFANYFMAGHFSNLRPLRQEKRIIRNKAIIWVILVVLALAWLLYYLYY